MHKLWFMKFGLCEPQGEAVMTTTGGDGQNEPLKIPSLAALQSSANTHESKQDLTAAPPAPNDGKPPAEAPKDDEQAPEIEVDPYSDQPQKPVDQLDGKKPAKDFIKERREGKEKKLKLEEVENILAEERTAALQLQQKLEEATRLAEEREAALKERDNLLEQSKAEIEQSRANYFDQHKAVFSEDQDPDITSATDKIYGTLAQTLPAHVRTADGTMKRVLPQKIQDPSFRKMADRIIHAYTVAINGGDSDTADLAVNSMAELLGANVKVTPDKESRILMTSDDPVFSEIERSMRSVSPDFTNRHKMLMQFKETAPLKAKESWEKRRSDIKSNLTSTIFMPQDKASEILTKDPGNMVVLFSRVVESSPMLKKLAEQKIAQVADAFSVLKGEIVLPTLTSNEPAAVAEHQQRVASLRQTHAEVMKSAVIGMCAPLIIKTLIEERDAYAARAEQAAVAMAPGDPTRRAPGAATATNEIPTDPYA